jgi:hypothetical protein
VLGLQYINTYVYNGFDVLTGKGELAVKTTSWKIVLSGLLVFFAVNAHANWQCYAADSGGHYWTSEGSTQERANAVALSFCSAYSPDSTSCHMSKCLEKS